ncbi:four-carbon acid sugar kinase family protein [Herbiconiux sp. A18JL235]|uniref:Four-carbon acid sugar kinase family protein n=1 Tax=Herbiconiux sp. A18JL235 TaxID=3152363 RepID=A0AB39BKP0_9MICO
MKTVILDDDPTGTQSASNVPVLFATSADPLDSALLVEVLEQHDSVYLLTNSRAVDEPAAVSLVTRIREQSLLAGEALREEVQFVLRGDSTLRGHVFAESEVFLEADADAVLVFVPAFPDGGRTTVDGVHYVSVNGETLPADETEFADDPVFPFETARLVDYVAAKSSRAAVPFPLARVRSEPGALAALLSSAPAGSVVVPDAETNDDIRSIARAVGQARRGGRAVVVRSASPLAAALAGVESVGLLPVPLVSEPVATLLVCGSHTAGATAQLAEVARLWGGFSVIDTDRALVAAAAEGRRAADAARSGLASRSMAVVTTERVRSTSHNTLGHGERVMEALTTAVRALLPEVGVVVSKGGITSAEVARVGLGAGSATVLGQVLPGVSVWRLTAVDGRSLLYVVVPGNVGDDRTLVRVLDALGVDPSR